MIEIIKYMTSGFWVFIGTTMILGTVGTIILYPFYWLYLMWDSYMRMRTKKLDGRNASKSIATAKS